LRGALGGPTALAAIIGAVPHRLLASAQALTESRTGGTSRARPGETSEFASAALL
jgi:hypothetical protein